MQNVDIKTVNPDTLVDIRTVVIDDSLPRDERIKSYLEQIKNPYCFKCNGVIMKVSFNEDGEPLERLMENLILTL
jgi:RecJ-like exonuclease